MFGSMFNNKKSKIDNQVTVKAPITGKVVDLSEVRDEVFASKIVGVGIAIDPSEGSLIAPFDGKVKQVFSTGHAVVLQSKEGLVILIHIGLDTVNLKGEGFKILVSEGQDIKIGDPIIDFDMDVIRKNHYILQTPVVIPEGDNVKDIEFTKEKYVNKGKDLLMKVSLSM